MEHGLLRHFADHLLGFSFLQSGLVDETMHNETVWLHLDGKNDLSTEQRAHLRLWRGSRHDVLL